MARYFDKRVAEQSRSVAAMLRDTLQDKGFRANGPVESEDAPGVWIVEARALDGFEVTLEVIGGPWENDGTWEKR